MLCSHGQAVALAESTCVPSSFPDRPQSLAAYARKLSPDCPQTAPGSPRELRQPQGATRSHRERQGAPGSSGSPRDPGEPSREVLGSSREAHREAPRSRKSSGKLLLHQLLLQELPPSLPLPLPLQKCGRAVFGIAASAVSVRSQKCPWIAYLFHYFLDVYWIICVINRIFQYFSTFFSKIPVVSVIFPKNAISS